MNPIVQGKVTDAIRSLQEPEPTKVLQAGNFNITRKGEGDVQEVVVGTGKAVKADKIDGNISADEFDRLW